MPSKSKSYTTLWHFWPMMFSRIGLINIIHLGGFALSKSFWRLEPICYIRWTRQQLVTLLDTRVSFMFQR
jgi:hypothetical protein